jgi:hypothetical protein
MPEYPKSMRVVNTKLIETILEEQGCCLIGLTGRFGDCFGNNRLPHHIKSRGSGGADERGNIIRVCWFHHASIHNGLISRSVLYKLLEQL